MKDNTRTYQTRPQLFPLAEEILQACADLFAHIEHTLLADISRGKAPHTLKSDYLIKYGITARQFNAIRVKVEGKIASIKKLRNPVIADLKERIESLRKKISKLSEKANPTAYPSEKTTTLHIWRSKLKTMYKKTGKRYHPLLLWLQKIIPMPSLISKPMAMHPIEEWLKEWRKTRTSEIFFLGSKDETSGNQTCTASLDR